MRIATIAVTALAVAAAAPAGAEVTASSDAGFVSHTVAEVPVAADAVWRAILQPAGWWNGDHTYSGDARNLSLTATPGGCFCEAIPNGGGAIEHMRVLYVAPGSTLRLSGGLGPLQSEAVTAVLTIALEPAGSGTRITWDFVVGGYSRTKLTDLAPIVDRVVGEQLSRLAASLSER